MPRAKLIEGGSYPKQERQPFLYHNSDLTLNSTGDQIPTIYRLVAIATRTRKIAMSILETLTFSDSTKRTANTDE